MPESSVPRIPRVQFRSTGPLAGGTLTGAVGSILSSTLEVPYGCVVWDWLSNLDPDIDVNLKDSFSHRWQGQDDMFVPAAHMSVRPGLGVGTMGRYQWPMDDPSDWSNPEDSAATIIQKQLNKANDTLIFVQARKNLADPIEVWLAAQILLSWHDRNKAYPEKLLGDTWWKQFWECRRPWVTTFDVELGANAPAGRTSQTFNTQVQGDTLITRILYTGDPNITAQLNTTRTREMTIGLANQDLRIDLLGACQGLSPGGNIASGYEWPGAFYCDYSDTLELNVASLAGAMDITERITLMGWKLDPLDGSRYWRRNMLQNIPANLEPPNLVLPTERPSPPSLVLPTNRTPQP